VLEGLGDALVGHRGIHSALHRLFALRELVYISEDQLALAAGVAGVDDARDVLAGEEFFQLAEAVLALGQGLEPELRRE
jgi:hypothetical protein